MDPLHETPCRMCKKPITRKWCDKYPSWIAENGIICSTFCVSLERKKKQWNSRQGKAW